MTFALHRRSNHLATMQSYLAYFRGATSCPVVLALRMFNAFTSLFCSKFCQHNSYRPKYQELKGQLDAVGIFRYVDELIWSTQWNGLQLYYPFYSIGFCHCIFTPHSNYHIFLHLTLITTYSYTLLCQQ